MIVEDRTGHSFQELSGLSWGLIAKANQTPGLKQVYTLFDISTPRVFADIDRAARPTCSACRRSASSKRCRSISARLTSTTSTCSAAPIRVTAQADAPFRATEADIANLRTRSNSGAMVPLGSVTTFQDRTGPYRVVALQRASRRSRSTATPRPATRRASRSRAMEKLAAETLPPGYRDRVDRASPTSRRRPGSTSGLVFGTGGAVRLPGARRAVRKPGPAAVGHPDRADVPARRDGRRAPARHGQQYPDADRAGRADRRWPRRTRS